MTTGQTEAPFLTLKRLINEYNVKIIEYNTAYENYKKILEVGNVRLNKMKITSTNNSYDERLTNIDVGTCIGNCSAHNNCAVDFYNINNVRTCDIFKNRNNLGIINDNTHTSYTNNINLIFSNLNTIKISLDSIVNNIKTLLLETPAFRSDILTEFLRNKESINNLNIEYEKLEEKHNKIKELIKENNSLTNEYNTTNIMINKSVFTYFLWVLLLLVLIFFIIKYVFYS